jgi:hypothetical protein
MKRIIALLISLTLLFSGCVKYKDIEEPNTSNSMSIEENQEEILDQNKDIEFNSLDDPELLNYVEYTVYKKLVDELKDESYFIENVSATYISKEYIEELEYNSKENIYFGYNLKALEDLFDGSKFIFTLGEDGKTIVKEFEEYDDTFEQVMKDVAIGSGVILITVTVSAVSGGTGAPAVSMIFATSAKTGTKVALSSGVISAGVSGIITGIQTKDFSEAFKSAVIDGSEGFKWGAIGGSIIGGASKTFALKGATLNGLTMNQAAVIQKESGYPLDVIKQFKSIEQYEVLRKAGIKPKLINGKTALIRDIDPNFTYESERTNLERMKEGLAALDPEGIPYELHHLNQKNDATLAILRKAEHIQNGNDKIWHSLDVVSEINRIEFTKIRKEFWESMAKLIESGGI